MLLKLINKYAYLLIATAVLFYSYACVTLGVCTWGDPTVGFEAMKHWLHGGKWNTIGYYDVNAGLRFTEHYLNWWAPGQYMIPWCIIHLFGVTLNMAQVLTIVCCGIISVTGYYKLMQVLCVQPVIIRIALLTLVLNRIFFWHYIIYFGGETLLWAATPWLCYILLRYFNYSWQYMLLAFAVGVVGVFLKSSFVIIYIAMAVYLFLQTTLGIPQLFLWQRYKPYIAMVSSVLCVYVGYLSVGATPSTAADSTMTNEVPNTLLGDIAHPWSSLVTHFFKIADFFQHFAPQLNAKYFDVAWLFVPFVVLSIYGCFYFIKHNAQHKIYLLAATLYVVTASILTFYYLQDKAVSYDSRHYYFMGNIAGIAILEALYANYKRIFKVVIVVVLLLSVLDFARFFARAKQVHNEYTTYTNARVTKNLRLPLAIVDACIKIDSNIVVHCDMIYTRALFMPKCTLVCIAQHSITKNFIQNKYIDLDISSPIQLPIKCYAKKTIVVFTSSLKNATRTQLNSMYVTTNQYISYYNVTPTYVVATVAIRK